MRRRPLMVRRLKLHVSKTGDITGSVEYRRSGKDVRNVLEVEKKFARPDVSLEQSGCMRRGVRRSVLAVQRLRHELLAGEEGVGAGASARGGARAEEG